MKVLVTGGAGFIGSALCRYLVGELGITVLNVDCLTYAADLRSLKAISGTPSYCFRRIDICDGAGIDAALEAFEPTAIIHLAAESHVDRSITSSNCFLSTNVLGTHTLLESARRYWLGLSKQEKSAFRFLHVSTDEVFGSLGPAGAFSESTPYNPSSPYSATKAASDHLVRAWHRTYGLPVLVCNCSNNYGPFQYPEKLIPLTILNAVEGLPLPVYGDGSNVRDWLFVDDHVRALWAVLLRGAVGESYAIGARGERTNIEVVTRICDALDRRRPRERPHAQLISFVADRLGHDRRYAIDPTKIESEIGWRAKHDFDSGIAKTVDWYLDNRAWWLPLLQRSHRSQPYEAEALERHAL
jgi:dTDP-glucose 4,6-dehydratase